MFGFVSFQWLLVRKVRKETVVSAMEQEVRSEVESEQAEMSTPRTSRR